MVAIFPIDFCLEAIDVCGDPRLLSHTDDKRISFIQVPAGRFIVPICPMRLCSYVPRIGRQVERLNIDPWSDMYANENQLVPLA